VTSVSLFARNALTVVSSVNVIERADWERDGSRRLLDTVAKQPGTMLLPSIYGLNVIAIRGYAQVGSARGIATLLDGIPMNEPNAGSGQYATQNIGLGVLDRIEVVRGPGSALYGRDAFHGVMAMTAFESEQDVKRMSAEAGVNNFYQAAVQHSSGFGNGARVNLAVAASGKQLDRTYQTKDPVTGIVSGVTPHESTASKTATLKMSFKPRPSLKLTAALYIDDFDTQPGELELNPETLDSYDFVFLTGGRHWTSELVLFENHWKDGITFVLDASLPDGFTYKNTGANKAHGLEASFTWQPDGPWRFDVSGSYIKSRNIITEQDYELFPRTMASIGIERRLDSLDADLTITNHIFDQAKYTSLTTSTDLPLYWRTDLVFNKPLNKKLDIHINLFDRNNRWPSVLGFAEGVADRPFSVNIGLRYRMCLLVLWVPGIARISVMN
jgi:outer membrane cobalamin receptor